MEASVTIDSALQMAAGLDLRAGPLIKWALAWSDCGDAVRTMQATRATRDVRARPQWRRSATR